MRNQTYIIMLFLIMILPSCQTDNVLTHDEKSGSLYLTNKSEKNSVVSNEDFENILQHASFIIGRMLADSYQVQNQIVNIIQTNNTIRLNTLMGEEFDSNFYDLFKWNLINIINCCPDPDHEIGKPPPPPPGPESTEMSAEEIADWILTILLIENCVELYFPAGLSFASEPYEITTTAHPLNSNSFNYGYKRYSDYQPMSTFPYLFLTIEVDVINSNYITENNNIIVARPYKLGPRMDTCQYLEYHGLDFTLFLN